MNYPPLITPDAVELAIVIGADERGLLDKVFGIADRDAFGEDLLFDCLSILVRAGRIVAYVDHDRPGDPRPVYEPTMVLNLADNEGGE